MVNDVPFAMPRTEPEAPAGCPRKKPKCAPLTSRADTEVVASAYPGLFPTSDTVPMPSETSSASSSQYKGGSDEGGGGDGGGGSGGGGDGPGGGEGGGGIMEIPNEVIILKEGDEMISIGLKKELGVEVMSSSDMPAG